MPEIRLIQGRTTVRIQLYPQDVADIVTQPEMMCSFTKDQVEKIIADLQNELATRGEDHEPK